MHRRGENEEKLFGKKSCSVEIELVIATKWTQWTLIKLDYDDVIDFETREERYRGMKNDRGKEEGGGS